MIIASSVTMHLALRAVRRGRQAGLRAWIVVTAVLGTAFLAAQTVNWLAYFRAIPSGNLPPPRGLAPEDIRPAPGLFYFLFFMLTGVHAAHVVGGLAALAVASVNAFRGRYTAARQAGVRHCAMYWHFLDAVWLVIVVVITLL